MKNSDIFLPFMMNFMILNLNLVKIIWSLNINTVKMK